MATEIGFASLIRKTVLNFQPYIAGKSMETVKRELGLKRVVKLASNENPLGPSLRALAAIRKAAQACHRYPESASSDLRAALARRFKVNPDQIILGCGSDEIIELIGKVLLNPQDNIVVSAHSFIRYAMAAQLMDSRAVLVPMHHLKHDLNAMAKAVTPLTKAVFIANPNNPTGTYNSQAEVDDFMAQIPPEVLVVFDEAYYEYARPQKDYAETMPFVKAGRNVMVLRTFSKIYGLAGLRVGYGIGQSELVGYLDRLRPPFNVNTIAQAAALASLEDKNQVAKSIRLVAKEKLFLARELEKLGLPFVPSIANFLMFQVPGAARNIFGALLKKGVVVRTVEEYGLPQHLRVTIGTPQENRIFLKALKEVLET